MDATATALKIQLTRDRETKNTVRFQEVESDEPPVIGTLYVQKYACKRLGDPDTIEVEISPGH